MRPAVFKKEFSVSGIFTLPGDKSISHRAVILGAIAKGSTIVKNFPFNKDCLATVHILQRLGVTVTVEPRGFGSGIVRVTGCGLHGLISSGIGRLVSLAGDVSAPVVFAGTMGGAWWLFRLIKQRFVAWAAARFEPYLRIGGAIAGGLRTAILVLGMVGTFTLAGRAPGHDAVRYESWVGRIAGWVVQAK